MTKPTETTRFRSTAISGASAQVKREQKKLMKALAKMKPEYGPISGEEMLKWLNKP